MYGSTLSLNVPPAAREDGTSATSCQMRPHRSSVRRGDQQPQEAVVELGVGDRDSLPVRGQDVARLGAACSTEIILQVTRECVQSKFPTLRGWLCGRSGMLADVEHGGHRNGLIVVDFIQPIHPPDPLRPGSAIFLVGVPHFRFLGDGEIFVLTGV